MDKCRHIRAVEKWFDGAAPNDGGLAAHIESCAACAAHLQSLNAMRAGVKAALGKSPLQPPAFDPFMAAIRERTTEPQPHRRRALWALASVTTAALLVAASIFLVFTQEQKADATVVESCSSDIEDATITSYSSGNGVTTVCINVARDDVW
jgi:anti-sigma factor RsiW